MTTLTDERKTELKQFAKDLHAGRIFWSLSLKEQDFSLLGSIFMPLLLVDEETRDDMQAKFETGEYHVVYAKMSDAGPRAINGYPMFMSCAFLSKDEAEQVIEYVQAIVAALDAI